MIKRGISQIITSVLIILISIVALSVIWVFVVPIVNDVNDVNFESEEIDISIMTDDDYTVYDPDTGLASVQIQRTSDRDDFDEILVTFSIGGESYCAVVDAPLGNNKKTYYFNVSIAEGLGIDSVGLISTDREGTTGDVLQGYDIPEGSLVDLFEVYSIDQETCATLSTAPVYNILCKEESSMVAAEKTIYSLMKYSDSQDLCFGDLSAITRYQASKIYESIDNLIGNNFIVLDSDVTVMTKNCNEGIEAGLGEELIGNWEYKDDNWDIYFRNYSPESGTYVDEWLVAWFCGGDYCDDELEYDSLEIVPGKTYLVEYDIIGFGGLGLNNHGAREDPYFSIEIGGVSGIKAEHFGRYSESITAETLGGLILKAKGEALIHITRISVREIHEFDCLRGEASVHSEGDMVYMDTLDFKGTDMGKISLKNLAYLNEQKDCNIYTAEGTDEGHFDYVSCYVENYAKTYPLALIGNDNSLIGEIKSYLESNIASFNSNYEVVGYQSTIKVREIDTNYIVLFINEYYGKYSLVDIMSFYNSLEALVLNIDLSHYFVAVDSDHNEVSVADIFEVYEFVKTMELLDCGKEGCGWDGICSEFESYVDLCEGGLWGLQPLGIDENGCTIYGCREEACPKFESYADLCPGGLRHTVSTGLDEDGCHIYDCKPECAAVSDSTDCNNNGGYITYEEVDAEDCPIWICKIDTCDPWPDDDFCLGGVASVIIEGTDIDGCNLWGCRETISCESFPADIDFCDGGDYYITTNENDSNGCPIWICDPICSPQMDPSECGSENPMDVIYTEVDENGCPMWKCKDNICVPRPDHSTCELETEWVRYLGYDAEISCPIWGCVEGLCVHPPDDSICAEGGVIIPVEVDEDHCWIWGCDNI